MLPTYFYWLTDRAAFFPRQDAVVLRSRWPGLAGRPSYTIIGTPRFSAICHDDGNVRIRGVL